MRPWKGCGRRGLTMRERVKSNWLLSHRRNTALMGTQGRGDGDARQHTCTRTHSYSTRTQAHRNACAHTRAYTHAGTHTGTHAYAHMHKRTNARTHTHTHTHARKHTHLHKSRHTVNVQSGESCRRNSRHVFTYLTPWKTRAGETPRSRRGDGGSACRCHSRLCVCVSAPRCLLSVPLTSLPSIYPPGA